MKCFVTGAGGFIGRRLCTALRTRGCVITAGQREAIEGPWDHSALFDLSGKTVAGADMEGVSCVYHLAGKAHAVTELRQDENEYFRINTEGTRQLLEVCKAAGVRRFVFFSSVKASGEGDQNLQNELAVCQPATPYGKSKLEAERLVLDGGYVEEPVVLRLSMVYGATRKGNLSRMIQAVDRGSFPPVPEVGNRRSMVHVEDVVQAALLVSQSSNAVGHTYIVTDGRAYSTREIYEWICEALGKPVPKWSIPLTVLRMLAKVGDGVGRSRGKRFMFDSDALEKLTGSAWYSSERIRRDLGFQAQRDLRDSLPEIVAWLGLK